ncbi:MAG TPA: hypothetical protein VN867_06730, partial [Candidatus Binataceae bacterium]|nr:hypothetical protein [Candidatus Binataceae bacterium]
VPLVVVELKCGSNSGYTTHDVLTYSAKAARHKELYPYLRYGMAIGGVTSVGRKFFFTNRALDFVVAVPDADAGYQRLVEVVSNQVHLAEDALEILDRQINPRVTSWQNGMKWQWAPKAANGDDDIDQED